MKETKEKKGMGDDVEGMHADGFLGVCSWRGRGGPGTPLGVGYVVVKY